MLFKTRRISLKILITVLTIILIYGLSCTLPRSRSIQSVKPVISEQSRAIVTATNPRKKEKGPFKCFWFMADHNWTELNSFSDIKNDQDKILIANMQTTNGNDPAGLRFDNNDSNGIKENITVMVEEERSFINSRGVDEIDHYEEIIGGLLVDEGAIYDYEGTVIGNALSVDIAQDNFDQEHTIQVPTGFDNPVVFANIRTYNGNHPAHVRIINVTKFNSLFFNITFKVEEWDYLCHDTNVNYDEDFNDGGRHAEERIDFLVLKEGVHLLHNDHPYGPDLLEVGRYEIQNKTIEWEKVKLLTNYSDTDHAPLIITQTQTKNGWHQIVTRNKDIDVIDNSFKVKVQEEEYRSKDNRPSSNTDNSHNNETVGYLAIGQGKNLHYTKSSVVNDNGNLQVINNTLSNQSGNPIQLKGMSGFWLNWEDGYKFANDRVIDWLVADWEITLFRAPLGVRPIDPKESGELIEPLTGYVQDQFEGKTDNYDRIIRLVDRCIAKGIYVIIDWHVHDALYDNGRGMTNKEYAKSFFADMSQKYGSYPNVIFEIWNEPGRIGHNADQPMYEWESFDSGGNPVNYDLKTYSEDLIKVIRDNDSDNNDNIIIVPTPCWDQWPMEVVGDSISGTPTGGTPLSASNIIYTFHFYAGSHTPYGGNANELGLPNGNEFDPPLEHQPQSTPANCLNSVIDEIPIFVTEWGTSLYDGGQKETSLDAYLASSEMWLDYLEENNISWANWSISDKEEGASALLPGAGRYGYWSQWALSKSGEYIKGKIKE